VVADLLARSGHQERKRIGGGIRRQRGVGGGAGQLASSLDLGSLERERWRALVGRGSGRWSHERERERRVRNTSG
jgi:hypothetical protein